MGGENHHCIELCLFWLGNTTDAMGKRLFGLIFLGFWRIFLHFGPILAFPNRFWAGGRQKNARPTTQIVVAMG